VGGTDIYECSEHTQRRHTSSLCSTTVEHSSSKRPPSQGFWQEVSKTVAVVCGGVVGSTSTAEQAVNFVQRREACLDDLTTNERGMCRPDAGRNFCAHPPLSCVEAASR
jgi:hypothetical protein